MCNKEVKVLLKEAKLLNYNIKHFKNSHCEIEGNGHVFGVSSTPASSNTVVSIKNRIQRLGYNDPSSTHTDIRRHF